MKKEVAIYVITEESPDRNSVPCTWMNSVISVTVTEKSFQLLTVISVVLLLHAKHMMKICMLLLF